MEVDRSTSQSGAWFDPRSARSGRRGPPESFWNFLTFISETFGSRLRTLSGLFAYPLGHQLHRSDAMTRRRQPAKGIKMNCIVAILTASVLSAVIGGSAFAVEVPYTGNGDP